MGSIQSSFRRVEKKYMLDPAQYQAIREGMAPYMVPDQFGSYTICNLYYDTDDYQIIRSSLEKPLYKEKLRLRSYGVPTSTSQVFLELKKKFDGVVYKRRSSLLYWEARAYLNGSAPAGEDQISREIDYFRGSYHPTAKVFLSYDREAYAGTDNPELRLTFDTNLRWREEDLDLRSGVYGSPLLEPDQILMEIKIPGAAPVWLARLLSDTGAFPTTFSKYGLYYKTRILGEKPHKTEKEAFACA
jgi:hypothetical protein